MLWTVRYARTGLILLLALLWAPLVAHCQLEAIADAAFLDCSAKRALPTPAQPHCDPTDCCALETGHYQLPPGQAPLSASVYFTAQHLVCAEEVRQASELPSADLPTPPPPELPTSWQFATRTVLPVRAPSLAS